MLPRKAEMRLIIAAAALAILSRQPVTAEDKTKAKAVDYSSATHKQIEMYTPEFEGQKLKISSFCLDQDQNFLFCSGGQLNTGLLGALLGTAGKPQPAQLTRVSPDRKVLGHVELKFIPTAINVAPNGDIFVAGDGNVARFSPELEILASASQPHIEDAEAYRKKKRKQLEEQVRAQMKSMADIIEQNEKKIKELEAIDKDKRTAVQNAQLSSSKQMKQILSAGGMGDLSDEGIARQVEAQLGQSAETPSLAVTEKDLFVTISSGVRYEVWRFDHDLKNPKRVVARVSGCCGQLDIQTDGQDLLVAENSRFRVVRFDRDGKRQNQFGSRDRSRADGFGSCCNPMNLKCCSNGDVLTAESSIGDIKRFSRDGKLVSYIGKAAIAGGCKQVTLAHDTKRDRFYMFHSDKNALCVLVPKSEAPEFTKEELAAKKAREGLGEKLVGNWLLDKNEKVKGGNPLLSGLGMDMSAPKKLHFFADGRLDSDGGLSGLLQNENPDSDEMAGYETQTGWVAKEQKGEEKLVVFTTVDRVEQECLTIEFLSESKVKISTAMSGMQLYAATYKKARK